MQRSILVLAILALTPSSNAGTLVGGTKARIDKRLEIAERTIKVLETKVRDRSELLAQRSQAFYKELITDIRRLWIDREARARSLRLRRLASEVMERDSAELVLIRRELELALAARERLHNEKLQADSIEQAGGLTPPVEGKVVRRFGRYRHRKSRARLSRRGIEFATKRGAAVRAPDASSVLFVGAVNGLGKGLILRQDDGLITVLGGVRTELKVGATVARAQELGNATGRRLYFEVRVPVGAAGDPVDPLPLLAP